MSDEITVSREELKSLMKEAVQEAFTKLGIQHDDPLEMQRDFQHLRNWRQSVESVQRKGLMTVLGILLAGMAGALWLGFTTKITGGH